MEVASGKFPRYWILAFLMVCALACGSAWSSGAPAVAGTAVAAASTAASAASSAVAAGTIGAGQALDQERIHDEYNEGNFDAVLTALNGFMAANKTYSHADSVFIAKHLAVVYSANPATREKGRYFMYRLLELLPSAKLVDMYVSEEIDRIFDKVREEFSARQNRFGAASAAQAPPDKGAAAPPAGPPSQGKPVAARKDKAGGGHAGLWVAGSAAVLAAGLTAAYFLHAEEPKPSGDQVFRVPKD